MVKDSALSLRHDFPRTLGKPPFHSSIPTREPYEHTHHAILGSPASDAATIVYSALQLPRPPCFLRAGAGAPPRDHPMRRRPCAVTTP